MSLSRELVVAAKARADAVVEAFDTQVLEVALIGDGATGNGTDVRYGFEFDGGRAVYNFVETAAREDVPVMADALLRVLDLHMPEERAHDGSGEWSVPLSEWDDDEAPETFTVCSHCGAIEMRESQGESEFASYLDALWPCATVRAVTGDDERSTT